MLDRPRLHQLRPRKRQLTTLLACAALVLGPIAGLGMTAGPAAALTCPSGTTAWEQTHYGELPGGGGEQPSVTTANNWGGGSACLTVPGSSYTYDAAFAVAQSAGSYTGNVLSDPDSNVGCEGGYCTSSDPLTGTIGSGPTYANPEIWWDYWLGYVNNSTSAYNEEINSNYSSEACTSNSDAPTDDTNLSIYVDADKDGSVGNAGYQGLGLPSSTHNTTTATIDGVSWYVLNIHHAGSTPSYKIEFSAETPWDSTTSDNGTWETGTGYIGTGDFVKWIESQTWGSTELPSTYSQCELDAGDEIWQNGANLDQEDTYLYMTTTP